MTFLFIEKKKASKKISCRKCITISNIYFDMDIFELDIDEYLVL